MVERTLGFVFAIASTIRGLSFMTTIGLGVAIYKEQLTVTNGLAILLALSSIILLGLSTRSP